MQLNKRQLALLHEIVQNPGGYRQYESKIATRNWLEENGLIWHGTKKSYDVDTLGGWHPTETGSAYAQAAVEAEMPSAASE